MSLNVILPNLSLAFSTVTFYQIARILLTPTVALLNYTLYRATLPPLAILALIPACLGVGAVSYYDSLPTTPTSSSTTSSPSVKTTPLGILFALLGTLASALYTTWIPHRRSLSSCSSSTRRRLGVPLLYVIPFADTWPASWRALPLGRWALFFIVAQTGAVSSTVVGHVKTVAIVALGYSVVMLREREKTKGAQKGN
ncbi:hypothetical protein NEMBOFW57_000903 [Staphylotrichum longicolle]|uniref:Uncharacterized protein n=1 Tax=Staphylotrichum longicolle TaxID=669026 RepID=A0AAD4I3B6_9PEZI|nr:hypothetical protein NEMBOFW57_000903 [Staphylotrichum longicolle]